ncbi:hypothetical protein PIB30_019584 [Stylosanthes scabra]|uniref:Uncharacterized protein n=1 Tax=Stylosanthes scabra TaxID=79078 RepID=A0ABU6Y5J1_9FABA|nr:hypothetical protein [Stylosanthes scabra]
MERNTFRYENGYASQPARGNHFPELSTATLNPNDNRPGPRSSPPTGASIHQIHSRATALLSAPSPLSLLCAACLRLLRLLRRLAVAGVGTS